MPALNKLLDFDSLDTIKDANDFYNVLNTIIKHGNLKNKASTQLMLYYIFSRDSC